MSGFRRLWSAYNGALTRRPLQTQMVQGGIICGAGDAIAQVGLEKVEKYDYVRTLRFSLLGSFFIVSALRQLTKLWRSTSTSLLFQAPTIRVWFVTLERIVGTRHSPVKSTLIKVKKSNYDL